MTPGTDPRVVASILETSDDRICPSFLPTKFQIFSHVTISSNSIGDFCKAIVTLGTEPSVFASILETSDDKI